MKHSESQTTLAVHLAEVLGKARKNYCRRLKRCRKKFSDKAVHKLRVETRRLLAMLDFFELARIGRSHDQIRKNLKKRLDAFDELRDTQVQLELLKPLWPDFPEAKPLKKFLKRREQRLIKSARKKLASDRARKLFGQLKDFQKKISSAPPPSQTPAVEALQKSFSQVVELRRKIHARDAAAIHKMRVAFKRFRYISELLQSFVPWITDEQMDAMRNFQSAAVDIQDLEILFRRISEIAEKKKLSPYGLRGLQAKIAARKKRELDFFMNRMDDLFQFQPPQKTRARKIRVVP